MFYSGIDDDDDDYDGCHGASFISPRLNSFREIMEAALRAQRCGTDTASVLALLPFTSHFRHLSQPHYSECSLWGGLESYSMALTVYVRAAAVMRHRPLTL